MVPAKAIEDRAVALLAADTLTFNATPRPKLKLVKAAFTPNRDLTPGDLTFADFDGSAAKSASTITINTYYDVNTGQTVLQLPAPAGGWDFETTGITNLPQTIHGLAVLNDAEDTLHGTELLPETVALTAAGQGVSVPPLEFRLPNGAIV